MLVKTWGYHKSRVSKTRSVSASFLPPLHFKNSLILLPKATWTSFLGADSSVSKLRPAQRGGQLRRGSHLVETLGCELERPKHCSGLWPPHAPVTDHIDGPQAQSSGDLDDCLPHSTVGCILDDSIPCGARKRPESGPGDLK